MWILEINLKIWWCFDLFRIKFKWYLDTVIVGLKHHHIFIYISRLYMWAFVHHSSLLDMKAVVEFCSKDFEKYLQSDSGKSLFMCLNTKTHWYSTMKFVAVKYPWILINEIFKADKILVYKKQSVYSKQAL